MSCPVALLGAVCNGFPCVDGRCACAASWASTGDFVPDDDGQACETNIAVVHWLWRAAFILSTGACALALALAATLLRQCRTLSQAALRFAVACAFVVLCATRMAVAGLRLADTRNVTIGSNPTVTCLYFFGLLVHTAIVFVLLKRYGRIIVRSVNGTPHAPFSFQKRDDVVYAVRSALLVFSFVAPLGLALVGDVYASAVVLTTLFILIHIAYTMDAYSLVGQVTRHLQKLSGRAGPRSSSAVLYMATLRTTRSAFVVKSTLRTIVVLAFMLCAYWPALERAAFGYVIVVHDWTISFLSVLVMWRLEWPRSGDFGSGGRHGKPDTGQSTERLSLSVFSTRRRGPRSGHLLPVPEEFAAVQQESVVA